METVVLFKPPDEFTALTIQALLREEGIIAQVRSYQIPWYDGIAQMMRPEWGEILVREEDYEEAHEILQIFLNSAEDPPQSEFDE